MTEGPPPSAAPPLSAAPPAPADIPRRITDAVSAVVIGKDEAKRILLVALLSGGHVLIEGLTGTAKTLLGKTFALAIGGRFKRIQLTPDMLPTDVTGFYIYSRNVKARFVPGPIFANIVLADELNRTTPRTQAAFLEAMQERQVTIEGNIHPLAEPFMVIASEIPSGGPGTYPLADVQADRFMFRVWSGYASADEEAEVLGRIDHLEEPAIEPATTPEEVLATRNDVRSVYVTEDVRRYVVSLMRRIREDPDLAGGPSTRAGVALYKGGRALAFLEGRDFVLPDDIKRLALPALVHRIHVRPEAEMDGVTPEMVVQRALADIAVPKPAA